MLIKLDEGDSDGEDISDVTLVGKASTLELVLFGRIEDVERTLLELAATLLDAGPTLLDAEICGLLLVDAA